MTIKLADYRSQQQALPDLLNWASMIEADVILNKDGSLLAAFSYRGNDLQTAGVAEREQVSAVINTALGMLGSGWMLHVDAVRQQAAGYSAADQSWFPDQVTALIDAERREQFTGKHYFVTEYVMTLTWLPPALVQSRVVDMLVEEGGTTEVDTQEQLVHQFRQMVMAFEDRISSVLMVERLQGDALLAVLHRALTGLNHPVTVPSVAMYLDAILGGYECWAGMKPCVGGQFIQVVAIEGFPSESWPQMLATLDGLGITYRWSTRFIFQDTVEAVAQLNRYRRKWAQKVRGFISQVFNTQNGTLNLDAQSMVNTTDQALAEAQSGLVKYGYYTATLVIMDSHDQRLDESAREVRRLVNNLGYAARVETLNTMEAWLGSLPGHGVQNVRRPMMHTLNLADLLPLSAVWPGSDIAPCPWMGKPGSQPPALMQVATNGSTPFRFNLHVGDLGHTLMIGPTGSGKSTALGLIAAQFRRYEKATVFAFDKGRSLLPLTLAVGGQHFTVTGDARDSEVQFAPLAKITEPGWFGMIEDWCGGLFELQGLTLAPDQRAELHRALESLKSGQAEPTLSALQVTLQDATMKQALEAYTLSGETGDLLDSTEDGLDLSSWACFEIEELMNRHDRVRLPVLLYLFMVIEKRLTGQPALLILDEAWLMLGHDVFRQKLREWLKVLRKANCAVVIATQSLSDATHSGILDVLTESCPTKLFLANPEANSEANHSMYHAMGLSDAEIQAIAGMVPKREYFVKGEGRRIVDLAIGPLALAFIGRSDKESLANIKALWHTKGEQFPFHWLQMSGVDYEDYL